MMSIQFLHVVHFMNNSFIVDVAIMPVRSKYAV